MRLIGLVAVGCAFVAQPVAAQPNSGGACVLHVTGIAPPPPGSIRPNAFIHVENLGDPNDPLTRAYQYNSITRALALSDSELRTLLPSAAEVAVVRHPEGLARDTDRRARTPLYPRNGQCHAELIVSDVVGVFVGNARPAGLLQALLVGGNRLEMIFTFRRFDGDDGRPFIASIRQDGRLPALASGADAAALTEATASATRQGFLDFSGDVARRTRQ